MKVALVRPPEVNPYWYIRKPMLGIGYIAAYLESKGVECAIFDGHFNGWTEDETVGAILKYQPDLIGLTAMTHEICSAHKLAGRFKSGLPDTPIAVGGCHITALPEETLQEFPDFSYGVFGEGEKTMLELAEHLQGCGSAGLAEIDGLVYRNSHSGICLNAARSRLTSSELDALPYPAYHHYYKTKDALAVKDDYYTMMSSRGCPYRCVFCMQVLGRQVRRRSPESVVDEIEYAMASYGAHTIHFFDEIFLFNNQLTYETLKLMIERGLHKRIRWIGLTRADFVDEKLIKLAKEAGCYRLQIGVESGNNEMLKATQKDITVEQAEMAVKIIKKAGIMVEGLFILGHPGETVETVKDTVRFAAKLNTDILAIGIMTPYPGTKVYEMAKNNEGGYRLLTNDWSKFDKYGGKAMEMEGLPLKELEKWQRRAMLYFYLRNFRVFDLLKFVTKYRRPIFVLLMKHFGLSRSNKAQGY